MINDTYKIFQLMEYFITKYDYISFKISGLERNNELFIASKTNPHFQIIRISTSSYGSVFYDDNRLLTYQKIISQQFNLDNVKLLDIHINHDKPNGNDKFTTVCMDSNYHAGFDISTYYPGVYEVIHDVTDQENEIKQRIMSINNTFIKLKQEAKKRPLLKKIKDLQAPITLTICLICIVFYVITFLLSSKYDLASVLIMIGAQYNTFTLGLHQVFRLFTNAFLHASLPHLIFNLIAFYYLGIAVERRLKFKKYLILIISGILFSSLSAGILCGNKIIVGLSGVIYALFSYYLMRLIKSPFFSIRQVMPTIILNIMLNFLPDVSWQAHLGGAVCGILFYYAYNVNRKNIYILIVSLLIVMNIKYFGFTSIKPLYIASDLKVLKIYNEWGLNDYAKKISDKLLVIYQRGE